MNEEEKERKRYRELAEAAYRRGRTVFTEFLGLSELDRFLAAAPDFPPVGYTLFGGAEGCERVMARFGEEESLGYPPEPFPIACLHAVLTGRGFVPDLTHRDVLGALMHLGIRRDMLGDIFPTEDGAYFFCTQKIAPFLLTDFARAGRSGVVCHEEAFPPELAAPAPIPAEIQVASERLDGILAHAFGLSRAEVQDCFAARRVFADGRLCEDPAAHCQAGRILTLRGRGRVRYVGVLGTTKKGNLRVCIERYR